MGSEGNQVSPFILDPEIWSNLPYELVIAILEFRCIANLKRVLYNIDPVVKFDHILREHNVVITGSIILQCVLDETYEKSDVDFFIPWVPLEVDGIIKKAPMVWIEQKLHDLGVIDIIDATSKHDNKRTVKICAHHDDRWWYSSLSRSEILSKINGVFEHAEHDYYCPAHCKCVHISIDAFRNESSLFEQQLLTRTTYHSGMYDIDEYMINTECISSRRIEPLYSSQTFRGSLNFITVVADPKLYIENNFDFDLCSLWYDGERLSPSFGKLLARIFHRQITIIPRKYVYNESRYSKGSDPSEKKYQAERVARERARFVKYKNRGYMIINSMNQSFADVRSQLLCQVESNHQA